MEGIVGQRFQDRTMIKKNEKRKRLKPCLHPWRGEFAIYIENKVKVFAGLTTCLNQSPVKFSFPFSISHFLFPIPFSLRLHSSLSSWLSSLPRAISFT